MFCPDCGADITACLRRGDYVRTMLKHPAELSPLILAAIIGQIQEILYWDSGLSCWDPDKQWSGDEFDALVAILDRHGLVPHKAEPANLGTVGLNENQNEDVCTERPSRRPRP